MSTANTCRRVLRALCCLLVLGLVLIGRADAAAPTNDDFANATPLSGTSATFSGSNLGATAQPAEPDHNGSSMSDSCTDFSVPTPDCFTSVWYSWTAPQTGTLKVADCSPATTLDSVIAVYTGDSVRSLTQVQDDNGAWACTSNDNGDVVHLEVTSGTTYHFVVTGYFGATGAFAGTLKYTTPTTTDLAGPSGPSQAPYVFSFGSDVSPVTFECQLDAGAWTSCTSPTTLTGLAEGSTHTVRVRAVDGGNVPDPTPPIHTFTVDNTAPSVQITSGPADGSTVTTDDANFRFSTDDASGSFLCSLDGIPVSGCAPSTTIPAQGLCDGAHTFTVRGEDAAGNQSFSSRTWTISGVSCAPAVTNVSGAAAGGSTANISAVVATHSHSTDWHVEWGTSSSYGQSTDAGNLPPVRDPQMIRAQLSGLQEGQEYHFRIVASNATGTSSTDDQSFVVTPLAAQTTDATNVGQTTATVNGIASGGQGGFYYYFEYGPSASYGQREPSYDATQSADTGQPQPEPMALTGLTPNTLYHFRLVVRRWGETQLVYGADQTFTTARAPAPPSVQTGAATGITDHSVTLHGHVDNNGGSNPSAEFVWGPNASDTPMGYGHSTIATAVAPGWTSTDVTATIDSSDPAARLLPAMTYHYRLLANGSAGSMLGPDETFTTKPALPSAAAPSVTALSTTAATITSSVNPNGAASSWVIEYGLTTAYGSRTSVTSAGSGRADAPLRATLAGLSSGTTYHVRIDATNAAGTEHTADVEFRTLPVTTAMVTHALDSALHVSAASIRAKTLLRKGYYVHAFSAPVGGKITLLWTVRATRKTITIARGQASSAGASKLNVRVNLTANGRAQLKRLRRGTLRITLGATFVTPGRAPITRANHLLLKP